MLRHKYAGELQPRDKFAMAGGHYEILDVYETNDDEKIKLSFMSLNGYGRHTLCIDKTVMFVLL